MTMSEGNFLDEPEHSVGLDFEVEDGWGWEVEIEDIDIGANDTGNQMINSPGGHKDIRISLKPTVPSKLSGSQESDSSLISRVKSSPSFQELERAIGATLAVGLGEVDPSKKDEQLKLINGVITQKANLKKNIRSFNSLRHRVEAANGEIIPDHIRSPVGRVSGATMKEDLNVYLDIDTESRALILFHSPDITSFDIKTACQLFGSLYYFRSDFHAFGVTLVCYFDIRAAMDAHRSLPARLGRMASVHLSVMLQSTNGLDESRLVVSRVPTTKAESDVQDVFSGYGPLKSIQKSFNNSNSGMGGSIETCDYTVEYYNIQDAKLAISEINSSILNLLNVNSVVSCMHTSRRQEQLRKDVLNVLSQWRARISNAAALNGVPLPPAPKSPPPATDPAVYSEMQTGVSASEESSSADPSGSGASVLSSDSGAIPIPVPTEPPSARVARHVMGLSKSSHQQHHRGSRQSNYYSQHMHQQHPYSQVNGSSMVYSPPGTSMGYAPHGPYSPPGYTPGISSPGRYVSGPQNQSMMPYLPPAYGGYFVPAYMGAPYAVPMGILSPHGSYDNLPYLAQGMPSPHGSYENLQYAMDGEGNWSAHGDGDDGRRGGGRGGQTRPPHHNGGHSAGKRGGRGGRGGEAQVDSEFVVVPEQAGSGNDKRTTVMVRNIPNKYTQSMLLEEININFEGLYDFFYLPIDFKNKCNVGYAFINFMNATDVATFFSEFNGQRWRNFNSEKICSISYARIQGKAAMIARFQNSSLLEKDESYKPLLFVSKGPDKGKPESFPASEKVKFHQGYNEGYLCGFQDPAAHHA